MTKMEPSTIHLQEVIISIMFSKVTIVYCKKETGTEMPSVKVIPICSTLNPAARVLTAPEDCRKRQGGLDQATACSLC